MEKASDSSVHSDDNDTGPWKDKGDGGKIHKGDLVSSGAGILPIGALSIGEDGHKDGYIGWAKKFMLIMPMIFMGLNAQVQSREIVDSLGTRVFTGFEDESFVASGGKVILDKKSDLPDSSWNKYDYYLTGQWDRVGIYLYDKTGKMDSTTWTNYVCNDSSSSRSFMDAYNSNVDVPKISQVECTYGRPKASQVTCANYNHPAYLAISICWAIYTCVYMGIIAGYNWFTYSSHDIRYYICTTKFKHSLRNKIFLATGVLMTLATCITAFYFLGIEWKRDDVQFSDVAESLSKIFIFLIINSKAMMDLSKSDDYDFDHISVSKDFPDALYIGSSPEEEDPLRNLYNIWREISMTEDQVLFRFKETYLHLALSGKIDKNDDFLQKVVDLFRTPDLDEVKAKVNEELELMKDDPVLTSSVTDDDTMPLSDAEKVTLVRNLSTKHVPMYVDVARKVMMLLVPIGIIFMSAFQNIMFVGQNAENFEEGGFEEGDRPRVSAPSDETVIFLRYIGVNPVFPGDLGDSVVYGDPYNVNEYAPTYHREVQCYAWLDTIRERMITGLPNWDCNTDKVYPPKTLRTSVICPFTESPLFICMLTFWVLYVAFLAFILAVALSRFETTDVRFYLAMDRVKTRPIWRTIFTGGYVLLALTFLIALIYTSMRPYAIWTEVANVFIFLWLTSKVFLEIDTPPVFKFDDLTVTIEEAYPQPIRIVVEQYSEASVFPSARSVNSLVTQMSSLYLKAYVLGEQMFVSRLVDFESAEEILNRTIAGLTIEGLEMTPKGVDDKMPLRSEDPDQEKSAI